MKRIFTFLLALIVFTVPAFALEPVPEDAINLNVPSAILMEKETGTVIYEKNAREHMAPASVTKVMTLLLVMEQIAGGAMTEDDIVTASSHAASMGGSQIWLEEGEQMTVRDLLKCVAVSSANDCAVALAEFVAGSEEAFVKRMNQRAAELGMADTNFMNCTGLFEDPKHYTCAYDIALMSRELIRHDMIKAYTTIWIDTVRDGKFGLSNTNKLIRFYDGATGLKTGYTPQAMYCLSATAERGGVEYIAVIMHAESINTRNEAAKALLNYAFANYALCRLRDGSALPPVKVELGDVNSVQPVYDATEYLLIEKSKVPGITYSLDLRDSVKAPVSQGQQLGTLTVYSGGEMIASVPIVSSSSVAGLGFWQVFSKLLGILASSV